MVFGKLMKIFSPALPYNKLKYSNCSIPSSPKAELPNENSSSFPCWNTFTKPSRWITCYDPRQFILRSVRRQELFRIPLSGLPPPPFIYLLTFCHLRYSTCQLSHNNMNQFFALIPIFSIYGSTSEKKIYKFLNVGSLNYLFISVITFVRLISGT